MKKVLITSLILCAASLIVGCSSVNDGNNNLRSMPATASVVGNEEILDNTINQQKAMKLYKKYITKVEEIYNKNGIEIKNLNEKQDEIDFVSRLVYTSEEGASEGIYNTWYGIIFDDSNLITTVGMYIDGYIDAYKDSNDNFTIKKSIFEDVGNLFFKYTTYKTDIENSVNEAIQSGNTEPIILKYKNGDIELIVNQNKLSMKIKLTVK